MFKRNYITIFVGGLLSLTPISVYSYDLDLLYRQNQNLNKIVSFHNNGTPNSKIFPNRFQCFGVGVATIFIKHISTTARIFNLFALHIVQENEFW